MTSFHSRSLSRSTVRAVARPQARVVCPSARSWRVAQAHDRVAASVGRHEARAHGRAGAGRRGGADGDAARGRADAAGGGRAGVRGDRPAGVGVRAAGAAAGRVGRQRRRRAVRRGAARPARRARSRPGCCPTTPTRPGVAALRAAGGRVVRPTARQSAPSGTRPDVVVDGIVGIGGRPGLRPDAVGRAGGVRRASRSWRSTCRPASTSTPASSTARTSRRRSRSPSAPTRSPTSSTRPPSACGAVTLVDIGLDLPDGGGRGAPARRRRGPAAAAGPATRRSTPAASSASAPARRPTPAPACSAWPAPSTGLCGMVRYVGDAAVADRVRQAHPEVVGEGRVQAWAVGSGGGDAAGEALAAALERRRPGGRRRRRAGPRRTARCGVPAVLTPHAGELAAMTGVDRADVEARPLHHARAAAATYDAVVLLKGRHTLVATPDGRRPGHHDRRPVAGDRRRGRRPDRADRGAARRRPRRRTTPPRSAPGCTAPPPPWPPAAARSWPATWPERSRTPSGWWRGSADRRARDGRIGAHEPTGDRARGDRGRPGRDPAQRAAAARAGGPGADDDGGQGRRLRPRDPARPRGPPARPAPTGSASPPSTRRSPCAPTATPAGCCAGSACRASATSTRSSPTSTSRRTPSPSWPRSAEAAEQAHRPARLQLKVDTGLSRGGATARRTGRTSSRPPPSSQERGLARGHRHLVALRVQRRARPPRQRRPGGGVPRARSRSPRRPGCGPRCGTWPTPPRRSCGPARGSTWSGAGSRRTASTPRPAPRPTSAWCPR